jgi:hypothetical protein
MLELFQMPHLFVFFHDTIDQVCAKFKSDIISDRCKNSMRASAGVANFQSLVSNLCEKILYHLTLHRYRCKSKLSRTHFPRKNS